MGGVLAQHLAVEHRLGERDGVAEEHAVSPDPASGEADETLREVRAIDRHDRRVPRTEHEIHRRGRGVAVAPDLHEPKGRHVVEVEPCHAPAVVRPVLLPIDADAHRGHRRQGRGVHDLQLVHLARCRNAAREQPLFHVAPRTHVRRRGSPEHDRAAAALDQLDLHPGDAEPVHRRDDARSGRREPHVEAHQTGFVHGDPPAGVREPPHAMDRLHRHARKRLAGGILDADRMELLRPSQAGDPAHHAGSSKCVGCTTAVIVAGYGTPEVVNARRLAGPRIGDGKGDLTVGSPDLDTTPDGGGAVYLLYGCSLFP